MTNQNTTPTTIGVVILLNEIPNMNLMSRNSLFKPGRLESGIP
jgi:hypothetical protein